MPKKIKAAKKETLVVTSKIYKLVRGEGLRIGGDFIAALSDKVAGYVQASIQKVEADGKKKTLSATDLA
jgi:hypothetical protein